MADLLFEIGTEEIPARFMSTALSEMATSAQKLLTEARLTFKAVRTMGTDRRLVLIVEGLAEKQAELNQEIKGPPKRIAIDNAGGFTPAAQGFAKKSGVALEKISFKKFGNEEYLFVAVHEQGKAALKVLPDILTALVNSIHLPIAMRWGSNDFQFIRPIHWLVCILDSKVIPLTVAGIKSGRVSQGHRFLSNGLVSIPTVLAYVAALKKAFVLPDQVERQAKIKKEILACAADLKLTVKIPEALLEEVTFINEYPVPVVAHIAEKYLKVPQECLIATMQKNQKYFPLLDAQGKLTTAFIVVANNVTKQSRQNIINGNVRVVTARLEDAAFFYAEDCKVKLETMLEGLKKVIYQEKIGTIYEKVERLVNLARFIAQRAGCTENEVKQVERVALLAKADLNSKMVYEFPELQGIMGRYYALVQQETPEVAIAIADHWKPRFAGEDISAVSQTAAIVAIADKLDTIVGCFAAGLIPSSSADPYALRRAAQGVVTLILDKKLNIVFSELIKQALTAYQNEKLYTDLLAFFKSRIKFVLQEQKVTYDIIEAVLNVDQEDIFAMVHLGLELQKARTQANFAQLVDTGVRVFRLAKSTKATDINDAFFEKPSENILYTYLQKAEAQITQLIPAKQYTQVLELLFGFIQPVTQFFDEVLIMAEDAGQRANRLALLKRTDQLFKRIGDFEKIVI